MWIALLTPVLAMVLAMVLALAMERGEASLPHRRTNRPPRRCPCRRIVDYDGDRHHWATPMSSR